VFENGRPQKLASVFTDNPGYKVNIKEKGPNGGDSSLYGKHHTLNLGLLKN